MTWYLPLTFSSDIATDVILLEIIIYSEVRHVPEHRVVTDIFFMLILASSLCYLVSDHPAVADKRRLLSKCQIFNAYLSDWKKV